MKSQGYATLTDTATGKVTGQCDTHQCCHCGSIIHAPANKHIEQVAEFCRNCMKFHCLNENCFSCLHFMKKIEAEEARYHVRRSYV